LWKQLTLKSAYTFSKTMDNSSEIFSSGAAGGTVFASQNQVNYTGQDYRLSGLDFPNNWVLTVIEELPFFRSQHSFLGHTLGGWAPPLCRSVWLRKGEPVCYALGVGEEPAYPRALPKRNCYHGPVLPCRSP
jgi:hypothetical protein